MPRMKTWISSARRIAGAAIVGVTVLSGPVVLATMSVVVDDKTLSAASTNVNIGIRLTNDADLKAVVVPLVIRTVTGSAFISRMQLLFGERLAPGAILEISARNHYATATGSCKPGGLGPLSFNDGASHPVGSSPEGAMFARVTTLGANLTAGADVAGSMILNVDLTEGAGSFDIDTSCADPSNHLAFQRSTEAFAFAPSFSTGTITVRNYVVTNLNDAGPGSLRSAIEFANSNPGSDTITFTVTGALNLVSLLPALTDAGTVILGFTAPTAAFPDHPTFSLNGPLSTPGAGLVIQSGGNRIEGLKIRSFDGPGIAITGATSLQNTISGCHFYSNTGLGIDLGNDGVTPNDPGDIDTGPNLLNNSPVFTAITEDPPGTFVLSGTASAFARVELYLAGMTGDAGFPPDANQHGPSWLYLASATAGPTGLFSLGPITQPEWALVTATSTDSSRNTSEFSENKYLAPDPMTITGYSETPPPLMGALSQPSVSPALQLKVYSPADSVGHVDSIGPNFNTFGARATYDSLTDFNLGGKPDSRVRIASPDTGTYTIKYILIGSPGDYLTGIGIDGHAEIQQAVSFVSPAQIIPTTYEFTPRVRGELNQDGVVDVFDVIASIEIVFSGAPMPSPPELIDVNCDVLADVFDVIYLIDYAFSGGSEPCP